MYVRRCTSTHFPLVLYREGFLNPVSLTQRNEARRIEMQYRTPVSGPSVSHLHSVHRAERAMRLEAVLSILHGSVEPSKIWRAGADVLLAKVGKGTGPYLSLVHGLPLARLLCRPHTNFFVPGEF